MKEPMVLNMAISTFFSFQIWQLWGIFPKKIPLEISAPFFICHQVEKFSHQKKKKKKKPWIAGLLYMMTLMHIECYLYHISLM
jgi:hypothetical protein